MRALTYEFLLRYAANVVHARLSRGPNRKMVKPMLASLFLTMKCNFRCTYCDDGSGNMYPDLAERRLSTAKTIEVLEIFEQQSGSAAHNPELQPF